jgi:hypothetical protein
VTTIPLSQSIIQIANLFLAVQNAKETDSPTYPTLREQYEKQVLALNNDEYKELLNHLYEFI